MSFAGPLQEAKAPSGDMALASVVEALPRSPSVWRQAWARLRQDRVGMVSLWIVGAFLLMVVLAQVGLLAGQWQREVGEPFAPPSFVGAQAREAATVEAPRLPNVDISDIDPLYYEKGYYIAPDTPLTRFCLMRAPVERSS